MGPQRGSKASATPDHGRGEKILTGAEQPTRRSQNRGTQRANQIIEAAEQMFCDHGYAATSMDDLAAKVGIMKGSLYYYVDSKDDLLYRIIERVHTSVTDIYEAAVAREDLGPLDRAIEYVHAQLLHNANHVTPLTVYYRDWFHLEETRMREIETRRREHAQRVMTLLVQAQELGEIPADTDLRLAMNHAFAVVIWPYTWHTSGSRISAEELARTGADFVRSGVLGAAPARQP